MLIEITDMDGDNILLNIDNVLYAMPEKNGLTYVNFGSVFHFYKLSYDAFKKQINEAIRGAKYVD